MSSSSSKSRDPRISEALRLLDPQPGQPPWAGGATTLGCLRGVSSTLAIWKPGSDRKSIWELALHVAYWKYAVRRKLEGGVKGSFTRRPSNFPALPESPDAAAWKRDRALLKNQHELLIESIAAFDPNLLDQAAGKYRNADLIFGIAQHDTYHVGQIQLMKRLFRSVFRSS